MGFMQIIEMETDRFDEGRKLVEEYIAKTGGRRTSLRSVAGQDRDRPGHYVNVVFFDSYEDAMANSELPETQELAAGLAELTTRPPTFTNLDVVWDES